MDHVAHSNALAAEIERMHSDLSGVDWRAPVPSCPEWDVAALVEHVGMIHRWAAQLVRDRSTERLDRATIDFDLPPVPEGLQEWFAAGGAQLVDAVRGADGDQAMWAWGTDQHVRFWSRRQLHETAVHHADLRIALGVEPPLTVDAAIAADGIDELLDNLPAAQYFVPGVAELKGHGEQIQMQAMDVDAAWMITLHPDGFSYDHTHAKGTVAVQGAIADLLLVLMNRRSLDDAARFQVYGERALFEHWLANATL